MSKAPEERATTLHLCQEAEHSLATLRQLFPNRVQHAEITQLVEMGRLARKIQIRADRMAAMIRDEMKRRQK